jgi:hypothetical protein
MDAIEIAYPPKNKLKNVLLSVSPELWADNKPVFQI